MGCTGPSFLTGVLAPVGSTETSEDLIRLIYFLSISRDTRREHVSDPTWSDVFFPNAGCLCLKAADSNRAPKGRGNSGVTAFIYLPFK